VNRMIQEIVTIDGTERLFWRLPGRQDRPILLMLHGTGSTAEWCAGETRLDAWAREHEVTLLLPEGRPILPGKAPKFLTNPTRWNDGSTQPGDLLHSEADDLQFLRWLLQTFSAGQRAFVAGFSNGAGMGFRLASESAESVAGLIAVAGAWWTEQPPARPVPTWFLLGDQDPLFPQGGGIVRTPWGRLHARPDPGVMWRRWAQANGAEHFREVWHPAGRLQEAEGELPFSALWLRGHGHHWPGGAGQLSPSLGGAERTNWSLNESLWNWMDRVRIFWSQTSGRS